MNKDDRRKNYQLDLRIVNKAVEVGDYLGASRIWYSLLKEVIEGNENGEFPDSFIDLGLKINEKAFREMYVFSMTCGEFNENTLFFFDRYIDSLILKLCKGLDGDTIAKLSKKLSEVRGMLSEMEDTFNL